MILITVNDSVQTENLSEMYPYVEWSPNMWGYFNDPPGREHYRLLANIAKQFPDNQTFADIGTSEGHSAAAMTANPTAKVITYDLEDLFVRKPYSFGKKTIKDHARIEFRVENCLKPKEMDQLKEVPFIFLDVDPHDGIQETQIIQTLQYYGYRGIVMCDDIHLNDGMKWWWNTQVPPSIKKVDLTKYGHWSGTGVLVFDPTFVDVTVDA